MRGTASSVSYSASNEEWTYTCLGTNGGASDSCTVYLDVLESAASDCRIEATDRSGIVPFETSFLCSGDPQEKTALVISRNGTIIDALE